MLPFRNLSKGEWPVIQHIGVADYTRQVVGAASDILKAAGAKIVTSDANFDPAKQVSDIENLLTQQPALLIVFPVDQAATVPGIKAANATDITSTITAVDAQIKVTTPEGPVWHRYNFDGYGETSSGASSSRFSPSKSWVMRVDAIGAIALISVSLRL